MERMRRIWWPTSEPTINRFKMLLNCQIKHGILKFDTVHFGGLYCSDKSLYHNYTYCICKTGTKYKVCFDSLG